MPILNEFWTVYGAFYGPKTFTNLEEAESYYEKVCKDTWSSTPSISHTRVIRRYGDASIE